MVCDIIEKKQIQFKHSTDHLIHFYRKKEQKILQERKTTIKAKNETNIMYMAAYFSKVW